MATHDIVMSAAGGTAGAVNYIDDVFSTYLYTGNGSTQTITNGIDLATKGGLVWTKSRSLANGHRLYDSSRPSINPASFALPALQTNGANANLNYQDGITTFNSDGFLIQDLSGSGGTQANTNGATYASWTFAKQAKFFDVVTYTGNGSNQTISHSLDSAPGCIIIKCTSSGYSWAVWHRSASGNWFNLNNTNAAMGGSPFVSNDSTSFTLNSYFGVNNSGDTYVAYLFAHDAGGFGRAGTDNVISCGSFTTDGSGAATVNLGYEPQYFLFKRTDSTSNWRVLDVMRGGSLSQSSVLIPNTSDLDNSYGSFWNPTATGFNIINQSASSTWIYIAIRRPMKPPTTGTEVFAPAIYTGNGTNNRVFSTSIGGKGADVAFISRRNEYGSDRHFMTKLASNSLTLRPSLTDGEFNPSQGSFEFGNDYFKFGGSTSSGFNFNGSSNILHQFRRAPGFFDVVCYTGDGTNPRAISHNLTVAPELIILKGRSGTGGWATGERFTSTNYGSMYLNATDNESYPINYSGTWYFRGQPTATTFTIGTGGDYNMNASGSTYVAYLFATCAGVSKVGSYTGNGSSQTINCGFSSGARFFLVKRTDSTGNWLFFDSARGIVSSGDPTLAMNNTNSEYSNDAVDPESSGIIVNQEGDGNINVNGGSYIYLAIA